jgi:hypothetical protein
MHPRNPGCLHFRKEGSFEDLLDLKVPKNFPLSAANKFVNHMCSHNIFTAFPTCSMCFPRSFQELTTLYPIIFAHSSISYSAGPKGITFVVMF